MNTFVDTNVFVYAKDFGEPERKPIAQAWLDYLWETDTGRISVQVLSELYNTLTRKLNTNTDPDTVRNHVRSLVAWQPLQLDESLIEFAWDVEGRFGLSWWDSLIVAAAHVTGCERLLTEDLQHGQRYGEVLVVSPFLAAPPPR